MGVWSRARSAWWPSTCSATVDPTITRSTSTCWPPLFVTSATYVDERRAVLTAVSYFHPHRRPQHHPSNHRHRLLSPLLQVVSELGWDTCAFVGHGPLGGVVALLAAALAGGGADWAVSLDGLPALADNDPSLTPLLLARHVRASAARHRPRHRIFSSREECIDRVMQVGRCTHVFDWCVACLGLPCESL